MTTRLKNSIVKPHSKYGLTIMVPGETEPTIVAQAVKKSLWLQAMHEEYQALLLNPTWDLVPPDPRQNLIRNKWVFHIKRHLDGSIS